MRPYMAEASEARGNVVHPGFVTWSLEPLMSTSNFNRSPILQGSRLIQPSIDEKHRVFATDGRQRDAIARYGIPGGSRFPPNNQARF
ncbi:hypothetical protein FRC19_008223 [Serendipita sp. 401]|nr:hypothetical protein FRC15_008147 [Serendipita sp. 397]KAG8821134.1 hypothetical protein FRC19_008223 [Serendipita sp. 401]KAG8825378.1 hypothetical protein FRC18_010282 [Serendipita sp. 400]KAG8868460.1 hypothetical protein FRC20_003350 [Serendipita sp. 405]KAG9053864.1 hypothetical protein FS842_006926 [Serendipita sp. 407]